MAEPKAKNTIKVVGAAGLAEAWRKYMNLFGIAPRGTERQLAALLELTPAASVNDAAPLAEELATHTVMMLKSYNALNDAGKKALELAERYLATVKPAPAESAQPTHVHTKQCYDDPGPANGHPFLVCGKESLCTESVGESIVGGQIAATGAGTLGDYGGTEAPAITKRASSDSAENLTGEPSPAPASGGSDSIVPSTDIVGTTINHDTEPHCCGCYNIIFAIAEHEVHAVCNECGYVKVIFAPLVKSNPTEALENVLADRLGPCACAPNGHMVSCPKMILQDFNVALRASAPPTANVEVWDAIRDFVDAAKAVTNIHCTIPKCHPIEARLAAAIRVVEAALPVAAENQTKDGE